jgi:hypothetical protein
VPPDEDLTTIGQKMSRVLQSMERDFARLRAGAASASLLDDIHVDHRGHRARLIEVASITIPDPRQIVIVPWDPASLRAIGAAISQSRIGLTPTVDGQAIRLYVPGMTEERRREIVHLRSGWTRPVSTSGRCGTRASRLSRAGTEARTRRVGRLHASRRPPTDTSRRSIAWAGSRKRA